MSVADDHELLLRIAQGDKRAFNELHRRYDEEIRKYIWLQLNMNDALADEARQEFWTDVWLSAHQYREPSPPRGWLFTVARHRGARVLRDLGKRRRIGEQLTRGPTNASASQEDHVMLDQVCRYIEEMPEADAAHLMAAAFCMNSTPPTLDKQLSEAPLPRAGSIRTRLYRLRHTLKVLIRWPEVSS